MSDEETKDDTGSTVNNAAEYSGSYNDGSEYAGSVNNGGEYAGAVNNGGGYAGAVNIDVRKQFLLQQVYVYV